MKRLIQLLSIALCLSIALSASLVSVFALSMNGVSLGAPDQNADNKDASEDADLYKDETVYVMAKANGTVDKVIVSDWIKNNNHADSIADVATLEGIENVKSNASYTLDSNNMRVWNVNGEDLYLKGNGTSALPVDLGVTYMLDGKAVSPEEIKGKSGKVTIRFDYTDNQYETVEIDGKKEKIYVPFLMMTGLFLDSEKFSDVSVTNGKVISDGERYIVAGIAFPGIQQDLQLTKKDIDIPDYVEVTAQTTGFELGNTVTIATNGLLNDVDTKKLDSLDSLKESLNKLTEAMAALIDGSSQLYSGLQTLLEKSGDLVDGVDQLYAGAQALESGAEQVDTGAGALSDGAKELDLGAITLGSGAGALSDGLKTLDANSEALNDGSDKTFSSILKTARNALIEAGLDVPELTAKNYAKVLDELKNSISEKKVRARAEAAAKEQVTAQVEANRATVKAAVTEAVKESVTEQVKAGVRELVEAQVEANRDTIKAAVTAAVKQSVTEEVEATVRGQVTGSVLEALGYSTETYNAGVADGSISAETQSQVTAAIDQKMQSEDVQTNITTLVDQNMQSDDVQSTITEKTQEKIDETVENQMNSETVQAKITTLVDQNMQSDTVQATISEKTQEKIDALIEENMKSDKVKSAISNAVKQAAEGRKSIDQLKSQLDSYKKFNTGLKTYTNGVGSASEGAGQIHLGTIQLQSGTAQLSSGAEQLKGGTSQLSSGATELKEGVFTLKNGVPALVDGVSQLKDGSMELSEGLKTFNDEGISKITKLFDGKLSKLAPRLKAMIDVSKHYKSYSGLTDEMDGEVKFIYKTEEIK